MAKDYNDGRLDLGCERTTRNHKGYVSRIFYTYAFMLTLL